MNIDWDNPYENVSEFFTVREALFLPSWGRMATENDGLDDQVKENLVNLFGTMDTIREMLGKPIIVHVAYRPKTYNTAIGGAISSAHILGKAVDWDCRENCDDTRRKLIRLLNPLEIRMENREGSNWVHIDTMHVVDGGNRYFIP